eukprot:gnl/Hemi2/20314_TR6735_c0_g1_i1.p1 gnl/Hemi2/20314_TR6735_c0_g1~~gnl/Hemi2/20314_TR6735_c0_g1_i1.p1  ORF type:complete len:429 (-),score=172.63 gnl/Hemi2/20314_TR6735_c0_g1_i1:261-1547(-)
MNRHPSLVANRPVTRQTSNAALMAATTTAASAPMETEPTASNPKEAMIHAARRQFGTDITNTQEPRGAGKQAVAVKRPALSSSAPTAVAAAAPTSTFVTQQQQPAAQPRAAAAFDRALRAAYADHDFEMSSQEDTHSTPMEVEAVHAHVPPPPPAPHRNIDEGDELNPQLCAEYVLDVYNHLRSTEQRLRPCATYMDTRQRDITATMRAILVDWLVEVAEEYRLSSDTLYLAVHLIDRFLSLTPVVRGRLQLVGITCALIAAKYEEIYPPTIDDFVYISDNTYSRDEIIQMESFVVNVLEFRLTTPTAKLFLRRFIKAAEVEHTVAMLASYFAELTLQEYQFLKYRPSMIAAAAVGLALSVNGNKSSFWTPTLEHYTQYSQAALTECLQEMHEIFSRAAANSLQSVREKFSSSRFYHVAQTAAPARTF